MNNLRDYFRQLRFDINNHLGLGDIRLTIGQQEEIESLFLSEIEAFVEKVKKYGTGVGAIPETNDYAKGWNACRKRCFEEKTHQLKRELKLLKRGEMNNPNDKKIREVISFLLECCKDDIPCFGDKYIESEYNLEIIALAEFIAKGKKGE